MAFFTGLKFADFLPIISEGFGKFLSFGMNSSSAGTQFERQKELAELQQKHNQENMRLSNKMSIENALNAGIYERLSKQRAGFNLNADGGFSPIAGASALSAGQGSAPNAPQMDFGSFAQLMQNAPLVKAQAELNEAQARDLNATAGLKERELKGRQDADQVYASGDFSVNCVRTGNFIEVEVLNEKRKPVTTKEGFDAVKDVTSWLYRDFDQLKLDKVKIEFDKQVTELRLNDNELIKMVADMPEEEFNNLVQDTAVKKALKEVYIQDKQLKIDEHELNELRKSSEENSSVGVLLDKLSKAWDEKDLLGALGTLVKLLFVSALTTISGNVSFSKGSSKSTVNSTSHSTSHSTVNSKSNSTSHVHTYKH